MPNLSRRLRLFACSAILTVLFLAQAAPVAAQKAPSGSGGWQFDLTSYGWFAGLSGEAGAGSREAPTAASFTAICHNLDLTFVAHFDVRASKSVSFKFGYAVVATDYASGRGATRFLDNARMEWPFMGVSFSF